MANIDVMYSSKSDEWATPQHIFDELNAEFGFDLDACATDENHKCENFFSIEDDGLSKNWGGTECFVIPHIARLVTGLKRHIEKPHGMITRWL